MTGHAGNTGVARGIFRSLQHPSAGASRSPATGQLDDVYHRRMNEKQKPREGKMKTAAAAAAAAAAAVAVAGEAVNAPNVHGRQHVAAVFSCACSPPTISWWTIRATLKTDWRGTETTAVAGAGAVAVAHLMPRDVGGNNVNIQAWVATASGVAEFGMTPYFPSLCLGNTSRIVRVGGHEGYHKRSECAFAFTARLI